MPCEQWTIDGVAFHEAERQEYNNCAISAGTITDHPVEEIFLRLEKHGIVKFYCFEADEAAAIIRCLGGALWSHLIGDIDEQE